MQCHSKQTKTSLGKNAEEKLGDGEDVYVNIRQ